MMGYVTKVNVKVGQNVSAGQLLVSINNTDLQAKEAQVDASITQTTAAYKMLKKTMIVFKFICTTISFTKRIRRYDGSL